MEKSYVRSPITEAVCEFRVGPDTPWDLTVPGLLYEKLGKTFPRRQQAMAPEYDVTQTEQGQQQTLRFVEHLFFFTDDGKSFVQVGTQRLSVHVIRPYPGWHTFRPSIHDAFQALTDVVETEGLQRIGLRYNNHIVLPGSNLDLRTYFEFYPHLGPRLPQEGSSFIAGWMFPFAGGRDICQVQLTTAPPESPDDVSLLLSLDYSLAKPKKVTATETMGWLDGAHNEIKNLFEGCITDALRAIFNQDG